MCKSNCGGSCKSLLKVNPINSDESLTELINLLNNISVCSEPGDTNKNLFMTEVTNLKAEARKLLDEVNHKQISSSSFFENIFEDKSFKERLNDLKERIHALSAQVLVTR